MAKLIFRRALEVNEDTGEVTSYWPDLWPLSALAREYKAVGGAQYFSPSYMCDPSSLGGNYLQSDWLYFYLPGEIEMARAEAGIDRGVVYGGVDPSGGGDSADLDYCAMMAGERIGNTLFMRSYKAGRWPLAEQAQIIDMWMDTIQPDITVIEEASSRGFVYTELTSRVNDGQGTRWPFIIERPKGSGIGAKVVRFLAMAARSRVGQIRFPGVIGPGGEVTADPRWQHFITQWLSFPAGHDDGLDAGYWCQYGAFAFEPAAGIVIAPDRITHVVDTGLRCERLAHVAFHQPLESCPRCYTEWQAIQQAEADREQIAAAESDYNSTRYGLSHVASPPNEPIGSPIHRPHRDFLVSYRSRLGGFRG